jgi:hypothetical protein
MSIVIEVNKICNQRASHTWEHRTVNDDDLAQMEEGRAPVRALDNIEEVADEESSMSSEVDHEDTSGNVDEHVAVEDSDEGQDSTMHESTDASTDLTTHESTEEEAKEESMEESIEVCESPIDRRRLWQESHIIDLNVEEHDQDGKPREKQWEQRQLYNIVDSVGTEILDIMVYLQYLISILVFFNLPIRNHLNKTAVVSDEQSRNAIIYGWLLVVASLVVIAFLTIPFRLLHKQLGGRNLTMEKIVSYIFRDNFWFLFLWLTATGTLSVVLFVNLFGADFTLSFQWLDCRDAGAMAWPGCLLS